MIQKRVQQSLLMGPLQRLCKHKRTSSEIMGPRLRPTLLQTTPKNSRLSLLTLISSSLGGEYKKILSSWLLRLKVLQKFTHVSYTLSASNIRTNRPDGSSHPGTTTQRTIIDIVYVDANVCRYRKFVLFPTFQRTILPLSSQLMIIVVSPSKTSATN